MTSERAARLGTYPVAAMARSTISRSPGSTVGTALMTRETVARETPAYSATCSKVGSVGRSRWVRRVLRCHSVFIPVQESALLPRRREKCRSGAQLHRNSRTHAAARVAATASLTLRDASGRPPRRIRPPPRRLGPPPRRPPRPPPRRPPSRLRAASVRLRAALRVRLRAALRPPRSAAATPSASAPPRSASAPPSVPPPRRLGPPPRRPPASAPSTSASALRRPRSRDHELRVIKQR